MKLKTVERDASKKRDAKRLRRAKSIPAVVYGKHTSARNVAISEDEFKTHLRQIPKGHLATSIFSLTDDKGKAHRAIVKDVQYHPTTYNILHMDFEELSDDSLVTLNVPVECVGDVDCVGVKQGGTMRQVLRHIRVTCYPKAIPSHFTLNVKSLNINDELKVADLEVAPGVHVHDDKKSVVVLITK
jgi:large subunit ribosomal protein L25